MRVNFIRASEITPKRTTHDEALGMPPYGIWTCEGGRQVLFNRNYKPLYERISAGAEATPADAGEWVTGILKTEMFYDDGCAPQRTKKTLNKLKAILRQWGVDDTVRHGGRVIRNPTPKGDML